MNLTVKRYFESRTAPVFRAQAARELGMSERALRQAISELNRDGVQIVSNGNGFRLTNDRAIIHHAAQRLRAQAYSMLTRASAIEGTSKEEQLSKMQTEMF